MSIMSNSIISHQGSLFRASRPSRTRLVVVVVAATLGVSLMLFMLCYQVDASIGYFENYGWPTYGIVKPFWMTPFSAFPSRSISGYSRKHPMHRGRGLINYGDGYR